MLEEEISLLHKEIAQLKRQVRRVSFIPSGYHNTISFFSGVRFNSHERVLAGSECDASCL